MLAEKSNKCILLDKFAGVDKKLKDWTNISYFKRTDERMTLRKNSKAQVDIAVGHSWAELGSQVCSFTTNIQNKNGNRNVMSLLIIIRNG